MKLSFSSVTIGVCCSYSNAALDSAGLKLTVWKQSWNSLVCQPL